MDIMKSKMTLDEIEKLLIDESDMGYDPDMKGVTMMLHKALTGNVKTQKVDVRLNVLECESSTGVEFERVSFYTRSNLDAGALEEAISGIPGCREMYHFSYDHNTGEGTFITICGIPKSGEYDLELPF